LILDVKNWMDKQTYEQRKIIERRFRQIERRKQKETKRKREIKMDTATNRVLEFKKYLRQ